MTSRLAVLCRPGIAAGFELSGLRPETVTTGSESAARVRDLLRQPETGVILMDDGLYDELPDELRREMGRRPIPLVVPFPGPAWAARLEAPEAYIVELLRQVIGYRVRLR